MEKIYYPSQAHTAKSIGSGDLNVLATPALIAFMENLAYEVLQQELEEKQSSVGSHIEIDHLAASLVSKPVTVRITKRKIDGRKHNFSIQAYVEDQLIATAQHTRIVVDVERFLGKIK